jgi:hypothetical protein
VQGLKFDYENCVLVTPNRTLHFTVTIVSQFFFGGNFMYEFYT